MEESWTPIEGIPKKRRQTELKTHLSKKRANHRNAILKDWAERLEYIIEPQVPVNYKSPFDKEKCVYCLSTTIGPTGDEFIPTTQRGRQNKINCVPCCGRCNSSKQDFCGRRLIQWIREKVPTDRQEIILKWWEQHEKYLHIPIHIVDKKQNKPYSSMISQLDDDLNKFYDYFS